MSTEDPFQALVPGEEDHFATVDYIIFAFMLMVSAGIGIFYAFQGVHKSHQEFVMGGRSMHCAPVALSLTASFMSAVTVLGTPAEVYRFGMKFAFFSVSYFVMVAITAHVFLPVYYRLRVTSAYEYLELRYNKYMRMTGTVMFILQTLSYSGIVIYIPSLALNQVTGFQLWGAIVGTGIICTFYCTLGGLRAVIWTDVFQFLLMICAFLLVIGRTMSVKGGLGRILDDARHGGRLTVWDFNPNPLQRHTFWTIVVGGSFTWLGVYSGNQAQVQRYLSCKTQVHAKLALYLNILGLWLTLICATLSGLSMYSMFKDCDPWTAKKVAAPDQAALTIFGIIGGPLLGILGLGVLFPSVNSKGAFSGLICGFITILWVGIGSQLYPPQPHRTLPLHLSTAGCHATNWTVPTTVAKPPTAPRPAIAENWYSISYLYLSPFGTLVTLLVGTVVSLLTGGLKQDIDRSLLFSKEDFITDYEYLKAKVVVIYKTFHPARREVPE